MRNLVEQIVEDLDGNRPVAWCQLVETRGSTPQKPGAVMLVYPDGRQAGTLGGGCVEAEVKRNALEAMAAGSSRLLTLHLDHDYGWDDGLICGGRMCVRVLASDSARHGTYFRALRQVLRENAGCTELVELGSESDPRGFLIDGQGRAVASVHHPGALPDSLPLDVEPLDRRPRPSVREGWALLPLLRRCRLIIVGGGHVGKAVGSLAAQLDFDVWVVDDRAEYVSAERFPEAQERLHGELTELLPGLPLDSDTYCIIVTRGHQHDQEALYHVVSRGARYVGLIGSRRKIRLIFEDLAEQGIPAGDLEQVHAPLGIDIGSQTVPEIAVSICAELVAHRNRGGRVPGRPDRVPVAT